MVDSHGTRELIGGEELVPHPETAAQTHGWRQPFETSVWVPGIMGFNNA